MPKRISSKSEAFGSRGVFILFQGQKRAPVGIDQGVCVMFAQFPWGPDGEVTEFGNLATFRSLFAPNGFDRVGAGYLTGTKFPWTDLKIVRVVSATASKALVTVQNVTPANCLTLTAKYKGTAGNSIQVVISAATGGVATSFDMTVTKTDSTTGKNTQEFYRDIDSTQTGAAYYTGIIADSKLLGALAKVVTLRPVNGTYTLAGAIDGTVASSDYIGTPGSADKGFALLETDPEIDFFFTDDVGAGLVDTVNLGGRAHVLYMNDTRFYAGHGLAAETLATGKAAALAISSSQCLYVWGHTTVLDDEGTKRTMPFTGPCLAMWSKLPPHLSGAIKRSEFTQPMTACLSCDVPSAVDSNRKAAESANMVCVEKNSNGVFSPYCAPCTDGTPLYVARMRNYIGFSLGVALEEYRGDPNTTQTIGDEIAIVETFLENLKKNLVRDQINLVCVNDYEVLSIDESNTDAEIQAGDATIAFNVQIIAEQKRVFLVGTIGTTVTIDVKGNL